MNEEQRKQRDARVAELAEAAVESSEVGGNLARSEIEDLEAQIRARINLALDEQAKEIAREIGRSEKGPGSEHFRHGRATMREDAARIAAGFGDDR